MDDTLNVRILLEDAFHSVLIAAVGLDELRTDARNLLNTIYDVGIRVGEVINNDYFVACILQFYGGVATDESGTASDENSLLHNRFKFKKLTGRCSSCELSFSFCGAYETRTRDLLRDRQAF